MGEIVKMEDIEAGPEFQENGFESIKNSTRVVLQMFRHNDKEKDPNKTDQQILLSKPGLIDAKSRGKDKKITYSIATGTDRARAQQTAIGHMAGAIPRLQDAETLEELKAVIDGARPFGTKIRVDNRLNFVLDKKSPFGVEAYRRYDMKEYLKFMVEDSDRLAKELGDTTSSTYSRQAKNVAEIVLKYVKIAKNFDAIYRKTEESERETNELKRFFGSHQAVLESFLLKLIDRVKGTGERDRLVRALGNNGFDFSEGFEIDITTENVGEEPKMHIRYIKPAKGENEEFIFDEDIPIEFVNELVLAK